jgi:hypothetical protein
VAQYIYRAYIAATGIGIPVYIGIPVCIYIGIPVYIYRASIPVAARALPVAEASTFKLRNWLSSRIGEQEPERACGCVYVGGA